MRLRCRSTLNDLPLLCYAHGIMERDTKDSGVPSPEVLLADSGRFSIIEDIPHEAMGKVLTKYLSHLTPVTALYALALIGAVALMLASLFDDAFGDALLSAFLPLIGLAVGAIVLLPVHELIHIAAYRLFGAKQATMQIDPKQLMALAVADRFVATKRQFYVIAAAPSVVLCSLCLLLVALLPPFAPMFASALFAHALISSGDWALFNLTWLNRHGEVYTFDDVPGKRTYFFGLRSTEHRA
jgi:hypothetical protein